MKNNHRVDVAAQRRAKMKLTLMRAGFELMALKGTSATSIDDVIREAKVARGTFYKYFAGTDELAEEIGLVLVAEVIVGFEKDLMRISDHAERLAAGIHGVLSLVGEAPVIGRFIVRAGWPSNPLVAALMGAVSATLNEGIHEKRFGEVPLPVAEALVAGITIGLMQEITENGERDDLHSSAVAVVLKGLGVPPLEAHLIASRLPSPPHFDKGILLQSLRRS